MENRLQSLEPGPLWKHFAALSMIPRGSGNETAAAKWVADQARQMGCEVAQDAVGNVIARKRATPGLEGAPTVALQAHVDMVCEKNEDTVHDFLADPIALIQDGDLLRADGTTLGADNGIGVAAALAVLESRSIQHGPLEVVITVSEETGLTGAKNLREGLLKAKYLLNLDSGKAGHLTIGCAGGLDSIATRRVALRPAGLGKTTYRLKVAGLKGGHSGGDINKGRGNAIRVLARVLWALEPGFGPELAALTGGNKRNAIPREASAVLFLDPAREPALRAALAGMQQDLRAAMGSFDPGLTLTLEPVAAEGREVMEARDARTVVALLFAMPHGVVANSSVIAGMVQTSTNLATVTTRNGQVEVCLCHRSAIESAKYAVADRVSALCELAGFEVRRSEGYPSWQPDPEAPLVKMVSGVHEALFGAPMQIRATHGGLECGIIGKGHPGLQMVSFGPDMWDNHSPNERVSISSVAGFWKLLCAVLEAVR